MPLRTPERSRKICRLTPVTGVENKQEVRESRICKRRIQTDIKIFLSLGNSSSAISAGKRRKYLPKAINPNAKVAALTSSPSGEGGASA